MERLKAGNQPNGLPEITAGEYLVEALFEAGPFEYHATGEPIALTWQTLAAYAGATHALSEPWEYRALISMSRAYVDGLTKGADEFCAPPDEWTTD